MSDSVLLKRLRDLELKILKERTLPGGTAEGEVTAIEAILVIVLTECIINDSYVLFIFPFSLFSFFTALVNGGFKFGPHSNWEGRNSWEGSEKPL